MRVAAFILIAFQASFVALFIMIALTTRSDAAGQGMANGLATIAAMVFVVFATPGLAVGYFTEQQWLALTLAILGSVAMVILMLFVA